MTEPPDPSADFMRRVAEVFAQIVPHARELALRIGTVAADHAELRLPLRSEFLGDTETGLVHTGVLTTLIDSVCGVALLAHLGHLEPIATLDLRVDYLRPTLLGDELVCRAECYRLTPRIAFLRASVWQDDPAHPQASAVAAFIRTAQP